MKIIRFLYKRKIYWGCLEQEVISCLRAEPFGKIKLTNRKIEFKKAKLLAPVVPSKVVLVGLNYKDHARELKMQLPKEPLIFLKPASAVIGPMEQIIYPEGVGRLDYEAELAVVIKKRAKNILKNEASKYILGYTCLNDVTARDLQKKDTQWTRAKSFDSFCPLGPWIETDFNPKNVRIRAYLNGKLKQDSSTSDFIFSVPYLVSFISQIMTLLPGDVISTGTPSGVGPMKKTDTASVKIEGLGVLSNRVI